MKTIELQVVQQNIPDLYFILTETIAAGSLLRLKANGVMMMRHLRVLSVVAGCTELHFVHGYLGEEMVKNWGWYIRTKSMAVVETGSEELPCGTPVAIRVSFSEEIRRRKSEIDEPEPSFQNYSGLCWIMDIGLTGGKDITDPGSLNFHPIAEPVALSFTHGPPKRIEAYLKSDGSLRATLFDAFGNPAGDRSGGIRIEQPETLWPTRVSVKDPEGRHAVSTPRPMAPDGTPIYFGETHWHTDISGDGMRDLEAALKSARDELALDFAGPADHMNQFGAYRHRSPEIQAEICRSFDQPGRFCTLPGSELNRRSGHCNLYANSFDIFLSTVHRFREELAPAWNREPNRYSFDSLAKLCPEGKAVIVPHHSNVDSWVHGRVTGKDGRPGWSAIHFPIPADRKAVRLFEMVQTRGAFETEEVDPLWRIYSGGFGGSARTALMRGYRVGFISGSDNHCGWPTRNGAKYVGITAVQAQQLDTESIFDALYRRRCYSSSGARIVADATLNGYPMGSELRLNPGDTRLFRIRIYATATLDSVQLIHCGYVLADFPVEKDSLDFAIEWADERPGRPLEDAWYYVRARQIDGHCVWLSPFWVDLPE